MGTKQNRVSYTAYEAEAPATTARGTAPKKRRCAGMPHPRLCRFDYSIKRGFLLYSAKSFIMKPKKSRTAVFAGKGARFFMQYTAIVPPRGRIVLAVWAALPAAAAAPFLYWQSIWAGAFFTLAAAVLVFGVWCRAASFAAVADETAICLYAGILYPVQRRAPRDAVCGAVRFSTPLLYLAGCRLVVLHTAGGSILLPAVSAAAAQQLCAWSARQDAPREENL